MEKDGWRGGEPRRICPDEEAQVKDHTSYKR